MFVVRSLCSVSVRKQIHTQFVAAATDFVVSVVPPHLSCSVKEKRPSKNWRGSFQRLV